MSSIHHEAIVTATHEVGHALVACALKLTFSHVAIWEHLSVGWVGKCCLDVNRDDLRAPELAAFNMGGAVSQMLSFPESAGKFRALFEPSIFLSAVQLKKDDAPLQELFWSSDFHKGRFLQHAADIHEGRPSEQSYLLDIEFEMQKFLGAPSIRKLSVTLALELVAEKTVPEARFQSGLTNSDGAPTEAFKSYVSTCPDRQTDTAFWNSVRDRE